MPLVTVLRDTLGDAQSRKRSAALRLAIDLHAAHDATAAIRRGAVSLFKSWQQEIGLGEVAASGA